MRAWEIRQKRAQKRARELARKDKNKHAKETSTFRLVVAGREGDASVVETVIVKNPDESVAEATFDEIELGHHADRGRRTRPHSARRRRRKGGSHRAGAGPRGARPGPLTVQPSRRATTASPASAVESLPPRSRVVSPPRGTSRPRARRARRDPPARRGRRASRDSGSTRKGFAIPRPARSGAEPCTGSKTETRPGFTFPEGASPRPPCSAAPRSERTSPKRLFVTTTSSAPGETTISWASASANMWRASHEGNEAATSRKTRFQRPPPRFWTLCLSAMRTRGGPPEAPGLLERLREGESRPADPLDAAARRHVLLDGLFLVGGARSRHAAAARVGPFGVLAEDDEVHVRCARFGGGRRSRDERAHGADVREEVEPATHPEQDLVGVPPVRDPRVAERPGKNGVEVAREHVEGARGNRFPRREEMVGAPGKTSLRASARVKHLQRLPRRLDADPVAGHDRDPHRAPRPTLRAREAPRAARRRPGSGPAGGARATS